MNQIANSSSSTRRSLFEAAAHRLDYDPAVVEKDFWVCWCLLQLFSAPQLSNRLLFKGGTSLTKAFGLLDRFSEDVDLVVKVDGVSDQQLVGEMSKSGQRRWIEEVRELAADYISVSILPLLAKLLPPGSSVMADSVNPRTLLVDYPKEFKYQYLAPRIILELGPVALWTPNSRRSITPYAAAEFPEHFAQPSAEVVVIDAVRTFWDKATILHAEAHRPITSRLPQRYSRHYYDLACMAATPVRQQALGDLALLASVAEFKAKCFPSGWANYATACPPSLRLVPRADTLAQLREDYAEMQLMLLGPIPAFDELLAGLARLEAEINALPPAVGITA